MSPIAVPRLESMTRSASFWRAFSSEILRHALLNPSKKGLPVRLPPEGVNAALNRAAVGLCLSSVEGSNYASMEYMLAGLPVVSTPSVGGREIYFDHEYCTICDPDPVAVRDAVEAFKARNIPRHYIRARTLAKIEPERRRFLALVDDLSDRLGGKRHYDDGIWPFAATSPLVTWKDYRDHLENFAAADARGEGLDADLMRWMAAAKGIQMQVQELRAVVQAIRSRSIARYSCSVVATTRRFTKAPIATARRRLSRTIPVGRRRLGRGSKRPAFI